MRTKCFHVVLSFLQFNAVLSIEYIFYIANPIKSLKTE